ncbi:cellular nucleic acid-binding protein-like [Gossypium australe]|uniref:Cellular nucleic acid-binding protein-like n=1 Tax=Gossypium australe TaxID=47621 RepID=A0A5B6V9X9_9ROSI|nr:cellular nucleic acid-binding protein-like [Gossypium australe]
MLAVVVEDMVVAMVVVVKWDYKDGKNDKDTTGKVKSLYYRCGGKNHWSRTCRTPKHLMELYQQPLKDKGKKI